MQDDSTLKLTHLQPFFLFPDNLQTSLVNYRHSFQLSLIVPITSHSLNQIRTSVIPFAKNTPKMRPVATSLFVAGLASLPVVSAHGHIAKIFLDGQEYVNLKLQRHLITSVANSGD